MDRTDGLPPHPLIGLGRKHHSRIADHDRVATLLKGLVERHHGHTSIASPRLRETVIADGRDGDSLLPGRPVKRVDILAQISEHDISHACSGELSHLPPYESPPEEVVQGVGRQPTSTVAPTLDRTAPSARAGASSKRPKRISVNR